MIGFLTWLVLFALALIGVLALWLWAFSTLLFVPRGEMANVWVIEPAQGGPDFAGGVDDVVGLYWGGVQYRARRLFLESPNGEYFVRVEE